MNKADMKLLIVSVVILIIILLRIVVFTTLKGEHFFGIGLMIAILVRSFIELINWTVNKEQIDWLNLLIYILMIYFLWNRLF